MTTDTKNLATISFMAEAHDSAAAFLNLLTPHWRRGEKIGEHYSPVSNGDNGYTVRVVLEDGETFDAEVVDIVVGEDDGQYKLVLAPWVEETQQGDRDNLRTLDIYDDIERIEVF